MRNLEVHGLVRLAMGRAVFALWLTLAGVSGVTANAQTTLAGTYTNNIAQAKQQAEQARVQVEQIRLRQAEYRASRNEAAAKQLDGEVKRYQDLVVIKQQEMAMYQQQETLAKQPMSSNSAVAAAQAQIRQWTFEKAQLGLRQTAANQQGNKALADSLAQQMNTLQLRMTAKQQDIRLLEMKAKAGQ